MVDQITKIYLDVKVKIKDHKVENKVRKDIRDFTVILIMKLKHLMFVIYDHYSISEVLNLPQINILGHKKLLVSIYYEALNNLLFLPRKCIQFLILKRCVYYELNHLIKFLSSKYELKRSLLGWNILDYITNLLRNLFSKANYMVWGNWTLFKNYFYQNLFATMYNFKQKYVLNDSKEIDKLEELIGEVISNFKSTVVDKLHVNYGLIDQLDIELYDKFLDIKSNYNIYVPIRNDYRLISEIQNHVLKFIQQFYDEYNIEINDHFIVLLNKIKSVVSHWGEELPKSPEISVQIG